MILINAHYSVFIESGIYIYIYIYIYIFVSLVFDSLVLCYVKFYPV